MVLSISLYFLLFIEQEARNRQIFIQSIFDSVKHLFTFNYFTSSSQINQTSFDGVYTRINS